MGGQTDYLVSIIPLRCEIKRCLLLGRKAMTDLDSIFKSRDVTLLTKVHIVNAVVFLMLCADVRAKP